MSQAAELHSEDEFSPLDEHDFVPHFQRVSISGEDTSGVPLEDLERASRLVIQALELREHHMNVSQQSFPATTARFLKSVHEKTMGDTVEYEDKRTTAGKSNLLAHSHRCTGNYIDSNSELDQVK